MKRRIAFAEEARSVASRRLAALARAIAGEADAIFEDPLFRGGRCGMVPLSEREGVAPLLYRALEGAGLLERLSESDLRALRGASFATAAQNLILLGELARIGPALESAIGPDAAVVLKGADLALTTYPSWALRPMGDLDLLVRRDRWAAAVEVCRSLGYAEAVPEIARGHGALVDHALTLFGGATGRAVLELHWSLIGGDHDRRTPRLDRLWERVERWTAEGAGGDPEGETRLPRTFLRLRPEAHLLYLAAHLVLQHGATDPRLVWLHDIHLLVSSRRAELDGGDLAGLAAELGWSSALATALRDAQALFRTAAPEDLIGSIGAGDGGRTSVFLELPADRPARAERGFDQLRLLEGAARLRFGWNHVFPARSYVKWRYAPRPSWLWPLCYPYRWLAIIGGGARAALSRARTPRRGPAV